MTDPGVAELNFTIIGTKVFVRNALFSGKRELEWVWWL